MRVREGTVNVFPAVVPADADSRIWLPVPEVGSGGGHAGAVTRCGEGRGAPCRWQCFGIRAAGTTSTTRQVIDRAARFQVLADRLDAGLVWRRRVKTDPLALTAPLFLARCDVNSVQDAQDIYERYHAQDVLTDSAVARVRAWLDAR